MAADDRIHHRDIHPDFDEDFLKTAHRPHGYKNLIVMRYENGKTRKFGQPIKPEKFSELNARSLKGDDFIYESREKYYQQYRKKKKPKQPTEDSRSLFDDPKLQRMRRIQTKKLIQEMNQPQTLPNPSEPRMPSDFTKWTPIYSTADVPESFYMKEPFKQRFGPKNLENFTITNEYDAFRLFFDDEIYTTIIKYTLEKNYNRYLESIYQHCNGFLLRRPSYQNWELTESDLNGYFAIQLFFGIVRMTNQKDYWSYQRNDMQKEEIKDQVLDSKKKIKKLKKSKEDLYTRFVTQKMGNIMPYAKYQRIRSNLNINSSEQKRNAPIDPIWKVRDFLNNMNLRFQKYYNPGEYFTIDEGMIPFNGRVHFKVFNPDKPTKWGIKEYILCDAVKSYTLQIKLYHGQTMWSQEFGENILINDEETQSRTMELVIQLLKNYENKQHKVVMDNYYTSWKLFRELKNRGFGALGTIRHNRTGLSKEELVSTHFQQIYQNQSYAFYINQNKDCVLLYFQGTSDKEVALISTFLDNSINENHMWEITKIASYVPNPRQPYMVHLYNKVFWGFVKYRGGVDRRNFFVTHYRSKFSSKKWWFSVFERLFETALLNAYVIYKCLRPQHYEHRKGGIRDFRINLMYTLSEKYKKHCPSFEVGSQLKKIRQTQHTFLEGEEEAICAECGAPTKHFCQECTILKAEVVGLCPQSVNIKCQRYHEFLDLNLDRNRKVFPNKTRGPDAFVTEVSCLVSKQGELTKQRVQLLNDKCNRFQTIKNLNEIIELIRDVQSINNTNNEKNEKQVKDKKEYLGQRIRECVSQIKGKQNKVKESQEIKGDGKEDKDALETDELSEKSDKFQESLNQQHQFENEEAAEAHLKEEGRIASDLSDNELDEAEKMFFERMNTRQIAMEPKNELTNVVKVKEQEKSQVIINVEGEKESQELEYFEIEIPLEEQQVGVTKQAKKEEQEWTGGNGKEKVEDEDEINQISQRLMQKVYQLDHEDSEEESRKEEEEEEELDRSGQILKTIQKLIPEKKVTCGKRETKEKKFLAKLLMKQVKEESEENEDEEEDEDEYVEMTRLPKKFNLSCFGFK